jgi:hypothetical protein
MGNLNQLLHKKRNVNKGLPFVNLRIQVARTSLGKRVPGAEG